ncbi:MAG: hypothetical protein NTZ68_00520 [Candidatus Dependentiae bacterium]|nr:hypothetical protein [Candidatus Dependentiae bacterium]
MKLKSFFFILVMLAIACPQTAYGMYTNFGTPLTFFPTPRYATKDLKSVGAVASFYTSENSYNDMGQEVGLLAYQGTETLLKRIVDRSLPFNDSQSVGKALISGSLTLNSYAFWYVQNIGEHFYFTIVSALSYIRLKNLLITPVKNNCLRLSETEIDADTQLKNYLAALDKIISAKSSCSIFNDATIGPNYFTIGYAQNFQNFTHIDFIDFSIQAGFVLPEENIEPQTTALFDISTNDIRAIRLPMQASATVGLYDWLNIGVTGTLMPYASTIQKISMPTTRDNNLVFLPEQGLCTIQHRPFVFAGGYIEAEHFIPKVSLLAGFSYSKQFKTTYQSWDTKKFPNDIINAFPVHRPWEMAWLTFSAEFDGSTDNRNNIPQFRFIYILPVYGKSTFKTSAISGQINFNFGYSF